jgi:hypothetical protein
MHRGGLEGKSIISYSPSTTLPGASPLIPSHKNPTNLTIAGVLRIDEEYPLVGF